MSGYTYLMNKKTKDLAKILNISEKEAEKIKTMTMEELARCEHICLETMNIKKEGRCRDKLLCCYDCRKEFLKNGI